ncbi:MAG: energy-coupling factor transporter transmembrane component T family protein [Candidatus Hodarchaeales archaeon]|jgi:energy-coupling factor transporter transmembrane protein EcfT
MTILLRKIYQGLVYRPDSANIHPIGGLLVLMLLFLLLIIPNPWSLMFLFMFVLLENVIFRNSRGAINILRAIFPMIIFLGILTFIFAGLNQTLIVILRLMTGAIGFSLYFSITNPSDLARSLEKLHIPSRWAMLPALSLTLVPRVAKDAEATFETLMMRGEISGYFRWIPKLMAIFIASVLYRSEFLAHSLYYRGFAMQKRSHYRQVKWKWKDRLRLSIWFFVFLGIISFY